ncbi:MAG: zinc-binding dehydrogenase [Planctomycetota bacterium]|jgi:NADPH:quinone reductase-like Zn-dependent oxidoreductase|nr:zinc-binding dehydrogenase [Planctomycetota bacterium]
MKAVRVHEHGGYEVLQIEDVPIPEPGPGQVRIKVAWAALNHLDVWVRRGVPGHRFPLPITPGCDFSGTVDKAGLGAEIWQAGQRVTVAPGYTSSDSCESASGDHNLARDYGIYGETCDGGNAEFAIVNAENLIAVPDDYSLDLAAAFPLTYLTAWHMLVERCRVQPGDKVLIHAAGSGVSVAATQIAKLFGANVMVTAGSAEKCALGLKNGADLAVNYREDDWTAAAKSWTHKRGLDIIVDHVGVDTLPKGVWALAKGGRIVTCGVTSGAEMQLNFAPIFFKSLSILGSTMGGLGEQKKVAELVFSGKLTPIIAERHPMEQISEAHKALDERRGFGKQLMQIKHI